MQLNKPLRIGEIIVTMYPDSAVGRRLASQAAIVEAVDAVAEKLGTEEASKEALRVKRFLGFAEKSGRGRKPADKATATEPAKTTTPAEPAKSPTTTGTASAPPNRPTTPPNK